MAVSRMEIVVISLIECHERRRYVSEQLRKVGAEFRFFEVERFKEYPPSYDRAARWRIHGNDLNLSEVGCYDSHYRVWKELLASQDQMWCVLEDDVDIDDHFVPTLQAIASTSLPFGFMRLADYGAENSWQIACLPNGSIVKDHRKQPFGMQGYVIHRDAAAILVEHARNIIYAVDDMVSRTWEHGVRTLSVTPSVVHHRNDLLGTTIGRIKAKRTLLQKLKREFYMARDSLNSHLHAWRRRSAQPGTDARPRA